MALIGFARVTSQDQDLEAQLDALKATGCIEIFTSQKVGKTDDNAEKLDELIAHVKSGDTVVLTKLYRLGRSMHKVLETLKTLLDKGVTLTTLDGQVDTQSDEPTKKAMTQLLVIFADFDRERINSSDKSKNNREKTAKKTGKSKPLAEAHINEVKKLFAAGISKSQLSKQFCVSRATIMQAIEKA